MLKIYIPLKFLLFRPSFKPLEINHYNIFVYVHYCIGTSLFSPFWSRENIVTKEGQLLPIGHYVSKLVLWTNNLASMNLCSPQICHPPWSLQSVVPPPRPLSLRGMPPQLGACWLAWGMPMPAGCRQGKACFWFYSKGSFQNKLAKLGRCKKYHIPANGHSVRLEIGKDLCLDNRHNNSGSGGAYAFINGRVRGKSILK